MDNDDMDNLSQFLNSTALNQVVKPTALTIGAIWLLRAIYYILLALRIIIKLYVVPNFRPLNLKKKYGEYVVITNVVDVMGKEFAKEFARKGHSLILISNGDAKFDELKAEIEPILDKHGGKLMVILKDTTKCDHHMYDAIEKQLLQNNDVRGKIGILLNNAGIAAKRTGNFMSVDKEFVIETTHNHVIDFLVITKFILDIMIENKKGLIVNVTTPRNCQPFKNSGFPRSMKQFVDEFTKIIGAECQQYDNIEIEVLNPGCIVTEDECPDSGVHPTPAEFVKSAMPKMGRVQQTSGYWTHSLYDTFMRFIPDFIHRLAYLLYKNLLESNSSGNYCSIPGKTQAVKQPAPKGIEVH